MSTLSLERAAPPQEPLPHFSELHRDQYEIFKHDLYDWDALQNPGYLVVLLTQGYFALVSIEHAEFLKFKWCADVQKNARGTVTKVYAVRWGYSFKKRGKTRVRKKIYLHRVIVKAGKGIIVDHQSGWTLDCRRVNLHATNSTGNNSNCNGRPKNSKLLRGVEPRWGGKFGGKIKIHGQTFRSEEQWDTQEPAHEWYCAKHKEFFSHCAGGWMKDESKYPVLPPRKGEMGDIPF